MQSELNDFFEEHVREHLSQNVELFKTNVGNARRKHQTHFLLRNANTRSRKLQFLIFTFGILKMKQIWEGKNGKKKSKK